MSSDKSKFMNHKHLTLMDCRKDLILQNDFLNQSIKNSNVSLFNRYSKKVKNNKMRIIYLLAFSAFFSMSIPYDFVFSSNAYFKVSSCLFKRSPSYLKQLQTPFVNYKNQEAVNLGQYYLKLSQSTPQKELTPAFLSSRIPQFAQLQEEIVDLNTFVSFGMKKGLKVQQLPIM